MRFQAEKPPYLACCHDHLPAILVPHHIEAGDAHNHAWSLVALQLSAFLDVQLHHLTVVRSDTSNAVDVLTSEGIKVPCDAEGVVRVALLETVAVPHVVRDVAIRLRYGNVGMGLPHPAQKEPSHRIHIRSVPETFVLEQECRVDGFRHDGVHDSPCTV